RPRATRYDRDLRQGLDRPPGSYSRRDLPCLRATAHIDHVDDSRWAVRDQGRVDHRMVHASEVREAQPIPDALPDADLLHPADADLPRRCVAHSRHETRSMKRLLLIPLMAGALSAQCVMCYRTAEGQNHARAMVLNKAIIILGAPPFLILA